MQFRKKPILIEAIQINCAMTIVTPAMTTQGNPGDWLITDAQGGQYFCEDKIFQLTYESIIPSPQG